MEMAKKTMLVAKTCALVLTALSVTNLQAQDINVHELTFQPVMDGSDKEWSGIEATQIALIKTKTDGKSDIDSVTVRFGASDNKVCFVFQWKDATHSQQHKPFIWDETEGKYVTGPQREDRLTVQFAMSGNYDTNWLSGKEFTADMWHWKSFRSNLLGLMHDKRTIVSKNRIKRAYKSVADDGSTIYIKRPSDAGDKLYSTRRYTVREQASMPKYILDEKPQGSVADPKAKGVWADGNWILEGCRKMDTGYADDVVFTKGNAVKGGIAIFNQTEGYDHNHSAILTFQF